MSRNIEINMEKGFKNYAVGEKGKLKRDLHPFWEKPQASTFQSEGKPLTSPTMGKLKYAEGNEFTRTARIR